MTLYSAVILLILVLDPFGNIPIFISLLRNIPSRRRKLIIIREMLIALAILTLFLFFGKFILAGMQISEPALSIAGGIMLFLIAVKMIFPGEVPTETLSVEEPILVPLAVPLVAGPSAMATVILFSTRYPDRTPEWFLALAIAWAFCAAVLLLSDVLSRRLGKRVLTALERLMGMILTTLAVQMLLSGIQDFVRQV